MKKNLFVGILLILPIITPATEPNRVLHGTCLQSYFQKYQHLQGTKAFAYARNIKTGQDSCGWFFGNMSPDITQKEALKACQKQALNSECSIVDKNGLFIAKEEKFQKATAPNPQPLNNRWKEVLLQEAKKVLQGNCLPFFEQYLKDNEHKAFAYSLDREGRYACGKAMHPSSLKEASISAVKACEEDKVRRDTSMPHNACRIYAENRQIILQKTNFSFKKELKVSPQIENKEKPISPLFKLAQKSDEKAFYALVQPHTDFNQRSEDGSTLLFAAVEGKSVGLIDYLLSKKIDINTQNKAGETVLHLAFKKSYTYIIGLLMQRGANPNIKNELNQTPFMSSENF